MLHYGIGRLRRVRTVGDSEAVPDIIGTPIGLLLALTHTIAGSGGPTGNGLLEEDGASFLLAENSDYLITE
tara:strand:- start:404 stop:616 length:213 start_codon:yes stop_codon:yes gene_type:complete